MKAFICIALLVACAAAAPEPGTRDKRWSEWGSGLGYSSYSLAEPLYSAPAAIIHEPEIVAVKKIVSVPRVVSVKKIVSYPHVSHYVAPRLSYSYAPRLSYSYAPRLSYSYAPRYSSGWW